MRQISQVTIIGTGLLGGSIGLALRAMRQSSANSGADPEGFRGRVVGVGRRLSTLQRARELGCIDEATDDLPTAIRRSDLIILCTPISTFTGLLEQIQPHLKNSAIVTDVGSTKSVVCEQARRILGPASNRFIGSHPMAGSEQHGPDAARAELFRARPCVVTPCQESEARALQVVETLWMSLGMRLLRMTPAEHDQHAANISHLPHAVAALLVDVAAQNRSLPMASTGFRDTTRVSSGDPCVWGDIFTTNRAAMLEAIDQLAGRLQHFRSLIEQQQPGPIVELLGKSKSVRDQWLAASDRSGQRPGADSA